ncbi:MAG TPA: hypothetical protein VGP94_07420, partial [Tepidisphaeraceae bacterium]|nr:hypothetical protein [Tepidisphaeraceae bacterium]
LLGLIFTGVIAIANGCNSTPPPRDYHEYSSIRAGQMGVGDSLGSSLAAQDSTDYPKAANPRSARPRQSNLATVPQE